MAPKVSCAFHLLLTWQFLKKYLQIGRTNMGFILDLTETLKTPAGIVGLLVVVGAVYALVKWVFAPHPDDEQ
jgi:hypothetical protein